MNGSSSQKRGAIMSVFETLRAILAPTLGTLALFATVLTLAMIQFVWIDYRGLFTSLRLVSGFLLMGLGLKAIILLLLKYFTPETTSQISGPATIFWIGISSAGSVFLCAPLLVPDMR
ncbi:MAG: hypothetical protein AAGE37_02145 [Pseudomonadota bacterium]